MGISKTLFKTITWRLTASITSVVIIYFLSGELKIAGSFAIFETISKTIFYYLHEKIWEKVKLPSKNDKENSNDWSDKDG
ncbi:MAG: DUF2061 domain-containing protein [Halanaerobiales bacterium]|nr:DUF2061 domain-containing protein [Halanaerobiales bacterium]